MLKNLNWQRGFALLPALLLIVALVVGGVLALRHLPTPKSPEIVYDQGSDYTQRSSEGSEWPVLWGPPDQNCQKQEWVKFTASPINVSDIKFVQPIGELREGHIIPGDHGGLEYQTSPSSAPVKVFAPADGRIVRVERHAYTPPSGYPQNLHHYHFYIVHSCTLFTGYVHLTDFTPEVLAESGELRKLQDENLTQMKSILVNIPVKAGQQIGTAWSFGLLGVVAVDLNVTNKGYLNPTSYQAENWRMHSVPHSDYFANSLQSQIMAKNPRTAEPRGGKIDFDIEGRLIGGWFKEGSGGFRDETKSPSLCGNFPCPYWEGHLALVYDYIDPTQLRVSVGSKSGLSAATPYGVKGNGPDFKDVGMGDGLVKYELVALKDLSREKGYSSDSAIITTGDESRILGTMLVQLMEPGKLKMEIFPGKIKDQVSAFTSNSQVYQR